jgi:pyruvate/2-oxoglutarate dehydrogenase complex dihydrolipoamide dehydrogenase (E3) component
VLGGGPVGCELAQAFARLGSQVTQVEMADRLLAREDAEASALLARRFAAEGIDVRTGHRALRIEARRLVCEAQGREVEIPFDRLLCALGRVANTAGYGLEELGIPVGASRTVETNEFLQTVYPNIYACGDVAGPWQFTHTASHQAWYAAVNALFAPLRRFRVDTSAIPWTTFTEPEVARVGLNEREAAVRRVAHEVTLYRLDELDRAIADGAAEGFVKVLTPPGSDRVLGATIAGERAGELIGEFVSAMKHGIGLKKLLSTIHVYPTFAEANKYAAGAWRRAHAPQRVLGALQRFHAWRRG